MSSFYDIISGKCNPDELSDSDLLRVVFEKTQDIQLTKEQIQELEILHPNKPLYHGIVDEEEFKCRHFALRYVLDCDYENVIKYCLRGLKINPRSAYLHFMLGRGYCGEKNYSMAINEFQKAIELRADFSRAYAELAITYFNRGFTEKMKKLDSEDPEKVMSEIELEGDFRKAEEMLEICEKIDPRFENKNHLLKQLRKICKKK